jgi:hypothetical protein
MDYLPVDDCMQAVFRETIPLSRTQTGRIAQLSAAVLLAGEVQQTKIARMLKHKTKQASRVRWIERVLQADYVRQQWVYQPFVAHVLKELGLRCWHLVMDRTHLEGQRVDLLTISLHYHKRAIPLVWAIVPYGGGPESTSLALVEAVKALVPVEVQVVFHADSEFGGLGMIQRLLHLGWEFMLGQQANWHVRLPGQSASQAFATLPVPKTGTLLQANIEVFAHTLLGNLNLMAFYDPHYARTQHKRDFRYVITSLPLSRGLRRLGRRRWGTEPFYRDYKSSGWRISHSQLSNPRQREGLLVVLALNYLWCVCLGRWLCKSGQRHLVDAKSQRHLSLFRLGWDWLVHCLRCDLSCPTISRLYS